METLVAGGCQQIAPYAVVSNLWFAAPDLGEHLMHRILGIVGIFHYRECHAVHVWIVVLEQAFKPLFTVIHNFFSPILPIRPSKSKIKYPLTRKKLVRNFSVVNSSPRYQSWRECTDSILARLGLLFGNKVTNNFEKRG